MTGRNQKDNADYFSHDADASSDEKIVYLESLFGHTGYAIYFKMLECMTRTDGFQLEWNEIKKAIYASKFGISVTEFDRIITECCREEVKAFRIEDGKIFSPGLMKRFTPLLAKREYNREKYKQQRQDDTNKFISATEKGTSATKNTQSKVKESKEKKRIYTSDFEKFWSAYPKKSCGKAAAYTSWKKQNGKRPDIDSLIQILEQHKKSEQWQKDGGQFIPMATTWLNNERWDAEMEIEVPSEKQKLWPDWV